MGVVGFEPTASWVKAMRSAGLNYTPKLVGLTGFEPVTRGFQTLRILL